MSAAPPSARAASGPPRPFASARAWLRGDEARDAALPAVLFVAGIHLFAVVVAAVAGTRGAGIDLRAVWTHWDVGQYLGIVADSYSATNFPERIVFFPLYPGLIRVGSAVADPLLVASAISAVATVVGAVGLYRLARLDAPRPVARWSVVFLLAYPASFSLVAPYTEALFLAAATWSLVLARRSAMARAGVAGFLAALTRLQGILLVPSLLLEAWRGGRSGCAVRLLWALLPVAAFGLYLGLNVAVFGEPLAFLRMQREYWFHENAMPWVVVRDLVNGVAAGPRNEEWATVFVAPLLAFGLLVVTAAWSLSSRRSRPSYAAYALLTLATLLTLTWPISVPRYVIGVVPAFLMLGGLARWPRVATVIALVSGACMLILTAVFVTGGWAF